LCNTGIVGILSGTSNGIETFGFRQYTIQKVSRNRVRKTGCMTGNYSNWNLSGAVQACWDKIKENSRRGKSKDFEIRHEGPKYDR